MLVYRTENIVNGKFYYGVHNGKKQNYLGSGIVLRAAIDKYGVNNFIRRTIMEFDTIEKAYAFEELIVDQDFVDRDDCYNIRLGGKGGSNMTGKTHSEETKRKMSFSSKTRKRKPHSEETKQKLREAGKKRKHSKETRQKMSASQKGNKNSLGFKQSEETILKRIQSNKLTKDKRNGII